MASSSPSASKELSCIDCSGSSDSDSSTQSDVESGSAPATKVVSLMDRLKAPKENYTDYIEGTIMLQYNKR